MFNNSQGQRLRRAAQYNNGRPTLNLSQNRVGPKPTRQSRGDLRGQSADLDMSWLNTRLSSPQDNSTLDFDNLISVEDEISAEYQGQWEQLSQTVTSQSQTIANHSKMINMLRMKLQQRDTKLKELEKVIQEMREFIKQSMGTMPPPEADPLDAALSF
ncbi:hypothetical protein HJFPF1_13481 [Paramyrothecium foliicola]|nr:hypothetical protein HJFPF1_13481 [Paramyrothecium foliicola]